MNKKWILMGFALLLLCGHEVSGFAGYYESFGDANDVGSTPAGEPIAWYSPSGNQNTVFQGAWTATCQSACTTSKFTLANSINGNWTMEMDYHLNVTNVATTTVHDTIDIFSGGSNDRTLWDVALSTSLYNPPCGGAVFDPTHRTELHTYIGGFGSYGNQPLTGSNSISGHVIFAYNTQGNAGGPQLVVTDGFQAKDCFSGTGYQNSTSAQAWNVIQFTLADTDWIDNLVVNDGNGTFTLPTQNLPAEFDTGIKGFASGLGFMTPESQLLFALILIGLSEIGMAFFTGFFGEGKWKIWTIHAIASSVGVICVLLGYLQFWICLVAIVLGSTIVTGGRETLNTFKGLVASIRGTGNAPSPVTATATVPGTGDASQGQESVIEDEAPKGVEADVKASEGEQD